MSPTLLIGSSVRDRGFKSEAPVSHIAGSASLMLSARMLSSSSSSSGGALLLLFLCDSDFLVAQKKMDVEVYDSLYVSEWDEVLLLHSFDSREWIEP